MLYKFLPCMHASNIHEIDLAELRKQGIRAIITDLDNTLVGSKDPHATPELVAWLALVKEAGFTVVIVSNNHRTRVARFADPLKIPYIFAARKPTSRAFHRAIALVGLPPQAVAVIGDQMMTDVLGGNRIGLYTILVNAISPSDESFFTKINRRLEKIVIGRLRKKGRWPLGEKKL